MGGLKGRFLFSIAGVGDKLYVISGRSGGLDASSVKTKMHKGVLVYSRPTGTWPKVLHHVIVLALLIDGLCAGWLTRRPHPCRHCHGALRHPRPLLPLPRQAAPPSPTQLWPCISSSGEHDAALVGVSCVSACVRVEKWKWEKARRESKKRVHFADDDVNNSTTRPALEGEAEPSCRGHATVALRMMSVNREALYCGML